MNAKPSAETSIHQAVYKAFPDANACYHVHSPECNILSNQAQEGMLQLPESEMLKGFGFFKKEASIPVFENHCKVPEIADEMAKFFKTQKLDIPVTIIRNHGVTVWANSDEQARNYVELIEYIFKFMVLQKLVGI